MIGFTVDFYCPVTIEDACHLFHNLEQEGKKPMYITGGTEFLTLARLNIIYTEAIIDVSSIPELNVLTVQEKTYLMGAAITLTDVVQSREFPLLAETAGRIADHTSRNSITLGGNLCGQIPYREAVLPLLLTDTKVIIASAGELVEIKLMEIFKERLLLKPGAFVVQMKTPSDMLFVPYFSVKRRKLDKIDYPLLTLAAICIDGELRIAISGLCSFPFRSPMVEAVINDRSLSTKERITKVKDVLPARVVDDWIASADYRIFVLEDTLLEMAKCFGLGEEG